MTAATAPPSTDQQVDLDVDLDKQVPCRCLRCHLDPVDLDRIRWWPL